MEPTLDPDAHGIRNDARRWWAVAGKSWSTPWLRCSPTGRSAAADLKRDMFRVETTVNGNPHRWARLLVQAEDIRCVGGPYTTRQAFELDAGWALAVEICRWDTLRTDPLSPATVADCHPYVTPERVAAIIAACADHFRRPLLVDRPPIGGTRP